ncbi:MAG: ATP-binding cassette domain-containing protein [Spirochaetales bacterium]|nr:ATP-binding cassette domain-containing protein [Spirochaetales bacterium]
MANAPYVHLQGITKCFPENGVQANRDASLRIFQGEIHALVGENGAGKSTLIHILSGLVAPDEGTIVINGSKISLADPREALRAGIGLVRQHVTAIESFSGLENLILGSEPVVGPGHLDRRRAAEEIDALMKHTGIELDIRMKTAHYSAGQLQKLAILTALFGGSRVLILDEPTAFLSDTESRGFFSIFHHLAQTGLAVVIVTHRIREILGPAQRITIMRNGRTVGEYPAGALDASGLASLMVEGQSAEGKETPSADDSESTTGADTAALVNGEHTGSPRKKTGTGNKNNEQEPVLLEFSGVSVERERGPSLKNISFRLREGELFGITGIREHGLELFEDLLAGIITPNSGTIRYHGKKVEKHSPRTLRRAGIAYVPTERIRRGISLEASVEENLILLSLGKLSRWGILPRKDTGRFATEALKEVNLLTDPRQPIHRLSGGQIQRVILARELGEWRDLVIISEPEWGLDLAGRQMMYRTLLQLRSEGTAVLVLSSDLEEVLSHADAIGVLHDGYLTVFPEPGGLSRSELGSLMLGASREGEKTGPNTTQEPDIRKEETDNA